MTILLQLSETKLLRNYLFVAKKCIFTEISFHNKLSNTVVSPVTKEFYNNRIYQKSELFRQTFQLRIKDK